MKRFSLITRLFLAVSLAIISTFSGCKSDYFDTQPDNIETVNDIFNNRGQTERWWAGLYSSIPDMWIQADKDLYVWSMSVVSDELDVSTVTTIPMNSGAMNPDETPSNFAVLYERIRLCTIFLERVDQNEELKAVANGAEIVKYYKGEARFLRAYYYWFMMKQLGPVVLAPLKVSGPSDDFQIPRSSWDECVAFILSEIDLAKKDMPVEHLINGTPEIDGTKVGRINQIIATALESQILLFHASPLYNGNTEMADFKNLDGKQLINQAYDASRWTKAAQSAKAAIDIAESNGKSLFKVANADPFRSAYLSCRNLFWDGWRTEGIWLRPASDTQNWSIYSAPRSTQGTAFNNTAVVQRLVDDFRMADGTSITNNPAYTETEYATTASQYYVAGTNKMYSNREPRFYVDITFNGALNPSIAKTGENNSRVEFFYTGTSGKAGAARDYPKTGYTARKNIHPTFSVSPAINVSRPAMLIRLAELYLNYVEALNEATPNSPDILVYLNKIRERGGLPALKAGLTQAQMREQIRLERRIELCFEGHRYYDVRRWKIANEPGSEQGGIFMGMNTNVGTSLSDPEYHKRVPAFTRSPWQRRNYFIPYGQNEMDRNKQLVQFPGY